MNRLLTTFVQIVFAIPVLIGMYFVYHDIKKWE